VGDVCVKSENNHTPPKFQIISVFVIGKATKKQRGKFTASDFPVELLCAVVFSLNNPGTGAGALKKRKKSKKL